MFRTRRELEARLFISKAARRRAAAHRNPNGFELIVGLSIFIAASAGCLYLVARLAH